MTKKITVLALATILLLTGVTSVTAGGGGRWKAFARRFSFGPAAPPPAYAPAPYHHYPHHYPTAEELYPKYYGGFHYRHLDNLGIPSGDIGIRGNSLYLSPW